MRISAQAANASIQDTSAAGDAHDAQADDEEQEDREVPDEGRER